ncbi:MAG TPA: hypothetical protein VHV09_25560 [Trebonia sp.]|nr:hypothetical protein [Trebonia sp.]
MTVPPAAASRAPMSATATAAAPSCRPNSESPLISPPNPIPIAPPTSSPSSHTSMLCAQPDRCSSVSEPSSSSVSQRGSRPSRQASATSPNSASAVVVSPPRRSRLRTLRPRCTLSTPTVSRGSGDHQATW